MKLIIVVMIASSFAFSQNLSPEEQKKLIQENKELKEEVKFLKQEVLKAKSIPAVDSAKTTQMMEALKKGQKFQEDQNKALEELDKEN